MRVCVTKERSLRHQLPGSDQREMMASVVEVVERSGPGCQC